MNKIDEFRQMLLEQLATAEGMEALVQAAAGFLQESFTVCDAAYTMMMTTAPHKNDEVFVVQSSQRRIMRPEIVEEMQSKGISERLQKSREAFCIYNASCGLWEIFCALSIHGQMAGYLFLRTDQQPDKARLEAWTVLGQALSVELQKGEYATPGPLQPTQSRILRELVEGEISQEDLILQRLRQTGWKPSPSYRLGCLICPEASLFSNLRHEQLLRQAADLLPDSLSCSARDSILLLCPAGLLDRDETGQMVKLRHWLAYHQFYLAVSMPFHSLLKVPGAHVQTRAVVQTMLRCAEGRTPKGDVVSRYEEVLPLAAFLRNHTIQEIEGCIHPHIRRLWEHDCTHGTEYITTLQQYFAHNRNTTAASAALFIHKTTLFYRLEQMEKLVGPFLKDPKLLFLYEYSLLLLEQMPSSVLTNKNM